MTTDPINPLETVKKTGCSGAEKFKNTSPRCANCTRGANLEAQERWNKKLRVYFDKFVKNISL